MNCYTFCGSTKVVGNTRVEYYQWRKFHGIQGRLSAAA